MERDILRIDPVRQVPCHIYHHRLRDFQPKPTRCPYAGHFSRPNAHAKSTDGACSRGVRIRPQDQLTRSSQFLLHKDLMTDAFADVVELVYAVLMHYLPDPGVH